MDVVEFQTPADTEGLGTYSQFTKGQKSNPSSGDSCWADAGFDSIVGATSLRQGELTRFIIEQTERGSKSLRC